MEFSIGDLSRRTTVKVTTIRYYEQIGLLPVPPRTAGGQRRYARPAMERLSFIRHARELGFDLAAIRTLLALQDKPEQPCATADSIARAHLAEVERRIARLMALREELGRMIGECGRGRVSNCRVIETLADSAHAHDRPDVAQS